MVKQTCSQNVSLLRFCGMILSLLLILWVINQSLGIMENDSRACYCRSYGCNGREISRFMFQRHSEQDCLLPPVLENNDMPRKSNLLQMADRKLYDGANEDQTLLRSLAKHVMTYIGNHGFTQKAMDEIFKTHKYDLPSGNCFPSNWKEAKALLKDTLVPLKKYDCCPNDCIIYRKVLGGEDYSKLTECPVCQESRHKDGTKIARKLFTYMPIKQRLQKYFGDTSIARLLHSGKLNGDAAQIMKDFQDGKSFRSWFSTQGIFEGFEDSSFPLGLFADGQNPNRDTNTCRSMWPLLVTLFSLPPEYRTVLGPLMVIGVIPGNSETGGEPQSLDPYVEVFVDEILEIDGSVMFSAMKGKSVEVKASLLFITADLPAASKLCHTTGCQGLSGCVFCENKASHSKELCKPIHLHNRRFLPLNHPFRNDPSFGQPESLPPPQRTTEEKELKIRDRFKSCKTNSERSQCVREGGFKGDYPLQKLKSKGFKRSQATTTDPMHTIADMVAHVTHTIRGSEDSEKIRRCEEAFNRFPESWLSTEPPRKKRRIENSKKSKTSKFKAKVNLPPAPWRLTQEGLKVADRRMKRIQFPSWSDLRSKPCFTKPRFLRNMHGKVEFAIQFVLSFCVRGNLGKQQEDTLRKYCASLRRLTDETQILSNQADITLQVSEALSLMERDFPLAIQNITSHLVHHIAQDIEQFGPVYGRWAYPYERALCWLARRIKNKNTQESNVMESVQLLDWVTTALLTGLIDPSTATTEPGTRFNVCEIITKLINDDIARMEKEDSVKNPSMKRHMSVSQKLGGYHLQQNDSKLLAQEYSHILGYDVHHSDIDPCIDQRTPVKPCDSYVVYRTDKCPINLCDPIQHDQLKFAQVQFFFDHEFEDTTRTWAYLSTFDKVKIKKGFLFANTRSSESRLILRGHLSKPIITAKYRHKVYFINLNLV